MMILSGLVGFLLVLTAEAKIGNSSQLEFCFETEQCLLFDLICETDKYEVRHYDSVKWVTTEESSFFMEIAAMRAFRRLFQYIYENKIEMTAPVVMKMQDGSKRFWETNVYTMSFLLPVEHQKTPPMPLDDRVKIHEMPAMTVYVRSFGGWMTGMSEKKYARSLSSDLDSVGANYKKDHHYSAGYNSPMTLFNRHNEVWFVADDDEPLCSSSEEMEFSPMS